MRSILRKLGWLLRHRSREEELQEEIQFHLEETADELQHAGVAVSDAQQAARRELGNLARVQEDTRSAWTWNWIEQFWQDLRYALRVMRRNPLFTLLASLSLALGIGANTAIYSFLDALLLRALPVAEPQRLAVLNWHNAVDRDTVFHGGSGSVDDDARYGNTSRIFPYPAFERFEQSQSVFSSLFAYLPTHNLNLLIRGQAEIAGGQFVSGDYFRGLGLTPAAGRLLDRSDDTTGAAPAIVLSFGFSAARFGSPQEAVGQTVVVNNISFTVVGVAPPEFRGVDPAVDAKFFLPVHANLLVDPYRFRSQRRYSNANDYWIELMGRLKPSVSMTQAESELKSLFHTWVETTATTDEERKHLPALHLSGGGNGIDTLRRRYSEPLYLLLGMVGLILAIACANIANLLLARATFRRREIAVRLGIGAGRGRVIRQLLTESLALAVLGGSLGILFAAEGVRLLSLLLATGSDSVPLQAQLDARVLAAALILSVATGLLFGLAPALQATRVDVMPAIRGDGSGERRRGRWRFSLSQVLVVSQIALSVLLLVGAGLFVRTLGNLQSIDLGFRRENILTFRINARQAGHHQPEIAGFYRDLQVRLEGIPGVRGVALSNAPLVGDGTWMNPVVPIGKAPPERPPSGHGDFGNGNAHATNILTVGPGFFSTMQIPLLAGREIDERDRPGSLPVVIVNETWARVNLPGENPIGQHVILDSSGKRQDLEIVGLAKDARYGELKGQFPAVVYLASWQDLYVPPEEATYALRSAGDPVALAQTAREIVRHADFRIPVTNLETQAAMIDKTMGAEKLFARLCSAFALLALLISCVGLYATTAYAVARRTSEIGLRVALGATRRRVLWMIARQVAVLATVGILIGIPAALGLSRLAASLLYGVKAGDATIIGVAVGALLAAMSIAAFVPARRASRIDPSAALRHD